MKKLTEKQQEKVFSATRKCLHEIGLKKMKMADVAAESGVSEDRIKMHFPDKKAVVSELMSLGIDHVTSILEKSISARGKADVKIQRFIKKLLTDYEIHDPLFKLVSLNFQTLDEEGLLLRKLVTQDQINRYRRNTAIIGRLIAVGQSEGIFRKLDPLECAYFLRGLIHGAIRYWIATNYEGKLSDYAEQVTRIFFTGIYK